MTERSTLKLLPLFFAIFLAICACEEQPAGTDSTETGVLYYTEGNSGEWVIVGLADPEGKAAFAPVSGSRYVIGIGSETNAGDEPVSMGTVQVGANSLLFTPFPEYSHASFTGTLGGDGSLTMNSIPGRSYSGLKMEKGSGFKFKSTDDPWGTGGGLPQIPGGPDFGGGGGGGTPPPSGTSFNAGRFVTDVVIVDSPTIKTAYEGYAVDLTGIKVEIHYSNGEKAEKTSANAREFIIVPPVYYMAYGIHTIRYVGEYNDQDQLNSNPANREFRAPQNNTAQGSAFYEILNTERELTAAGYENKEYFDGVNAVDLTGVSVKARYSTGERTINLSNVYQTDFIPAHSPEDSELWVTIGGKNALIPIKANKVNPMLNIQLDGTPSFAAQVLFDDARFSSGDAEKLWMSKLSGVNIRFIYAPPTTATRSARITELYKKGLEITFPSVEQLLEKDPKITFTFTSDDGGTYTINYTVPVYNRLASITVESTVGQIVMKGSGPLYPDDEDSFLRQVKIRAYYQMGSNKNAVVVRDNILTYPTYPQPAGIDSDLIYSAKIETNVGGDLAPDILTAANSKQETSKSNTIEVGVTGYNN